MLDTIRHDKTHSEGKYKFSPLSSREGLEEYNTHRDTFMNALGNSFSQELTKWLHTHTTSLEQFKATFDWDLVQDSVKKSLSKPISSVVDRHKEQVIDTMTKHLSKNLKNSGSNLAIFLKGEMTDMTPIQEAILMQSVMKAVQVGFTVISETKMRDLFELNVRLNDMELEMRTMGERLQNNEDRVKYNSAKLDAQQMTLALKAMDEAEKQLKLIGLGDVFSKHIDRSAQRQAVIHWIHNNLEISLQQFGGVGITTIVPKNSPSFVILNFLSASDARLFESLVFKKRGKSIFS